MYIYSPYTPSRDEQVQYRLYLLPLQQHITTFPQQYNSKFRFKLIILYASSSISSSRIRFGCCVSFQTLLGVFACACVYAQVCVHNHNKSPPTHDRGGWCSCDQQECWLKLGNPDMMLMFSICPYRYQAHTLK